MHPKRIATVVLIVFVGVSMAYLVHKEIQAGKKSVNDAAVPTPEEITPTPPERKADEAEPRRVIAYYFYGNVRCATCKKLEAYTKEAIARDFAEAVKNKALVWQAVNVDEPENAHFVKDYSLTTRSVVLVGMVDGKPAEWQKLVKIWDLVGDKEAYQKYIFAETSGFLKDKAQ